MGLLGVWLVPSQVLGLYPEASVVGGLVPAHGY